jgi:hypothetical protein
MKLFLTPEQALAIADIWKAAQPARGTPGILLGQLRRGEFPEPPTFFLDLCLCSDAEAVAMRKALLKQRGKLSTTKPTPKT